MCVSYLWGSSPKPARRAPPSVGGWCTSVPGSLSSPVAGMVSRLFLSKLPPFLSPSLLRRVILFFIPLPFRKLGRPRSVMGLRNHPQLKAIAGGRIGKREGVGGTPYRQLDRKDQECRTFEARLVFIFVYLYICLPSCPL